MTSVLETEVLNLSKVVCLDNLDVTISLTTEDGVVVKLMKAIDDACGLDVLDSLQSVHFIDEQVVVCTTNEKF